jgi:hypothetical protein
MRFCEVCVCVNNCDDVSGEANFRPQPAAGPFTFPIARANKRCEFLAYTFNSSTSKHQQYILDIEENQCLIYVLCALIWAA